MITAANHWRIHMRAHESIVAQIFRPARARSFIVIERVAVCARPRGAQVKVRGGMIEGRIKAGGDVS
jgi:hypothetical protein